MIIIAMTVIRVMIVVDTTITGRGSVIPSGVTSEVVATIIGVIIGSVNTSVVSIIAIAGHILIILIVRVNQFIL